MLRSFLLMKKTPDILMSEGLRSYVQVLNPLWVNFCEWCRIVVWFRSFASGCPVLPTPFNKDTALSVYISLLHYRQLIDNIRLGLLLGHSIGFSWFICLVFCQYHTILITVGLWYSLKSGSMMTPSWSAV